MVPVAAGQRTNTGTPAVINPAGVRFCRGKASDNLSRDQFPGGAGRAGTCSGRSGAPTKVRFFARKGERLGWKWRINPPMFPIQT